MAIQGNNLTEKGPLVGTESRSDPLSWTAMPFGPMMKKSEVVR